MKNSLINKKIARPLSMSRLAVWLLLAAGWVGVSHATADESLPEPQRIIQDVSERLLEVLRKDRERLKTDTQYIYQLADEILVPHVDFERVSRLVLGKYWRTATPEQRERFKTEFRLMLVRSYATAFHEFKEWEIRYMPLRVTPDATDVRVKTLVIQPGAQPVDVDYRMHYEDGTWKAYDVNIAGVSLALTYQQGFQRQVRAEGMDKLIERISASNDERASNQEGQQQASP